MGLVRRRRVAICEIGALVEYHTGGWKAKAKKAVQAVRGSGIAAVSLMHVQMITCSYS
jgi:hypothetical protein